jgi:hypothetical protein
VFILRSSEQTWRIPVTPGTGPWVAGGVLISPGAIQSTKKIQITHLQGLPRIQRGIVSNYLYPDFAPPEDGGGGGDPGETRLSGYNHGPSLCSGLLCYILPQTVQALPRISERMAFNQELFVFEPAQGITDGPGREQSFTDDILLGKRYTRLQNFINELCRWWQVPDVVPCITGGFRDKNDPS